MTKNEVTITGLCMKGSGVEIIHRAISNNIPNYDLILLSQYIASFPKAAMLAKIMSPIVHTTPELADGINSKKRKIVSTFYGFSLDLANTPYSTLSQSLYYRTILSRTISNSLKSSTAITAVSNYLSELVRDYFSLNKHPIVIPNGVDTDLFKPFKNTNDIPIVLFSGNLKKRKGIDLLYKLADSFRGLAKFVCTGGPKKRNKITPHDNIDFLESVPYSQMPNVYRKADILFLPTVREGCSMAILEAMACGLPIVTTNTSSNPELVKNGKGGELFELENLNDAAKRIKKLIESPMLRQDYGEFNRELCVKKYTILNICDDYLELFKSI